MHEVLVNRLGGLSLLMKSVVRLTDRPDMTLNVYHGRKTTKQQQQQQCQVELFLEYLFRKVAVCFAISGDLNQMPHSVVSVLSLHCSPKYPFGVSSLQKVNRFFKSLPEVALHTLHMLLEELNLEKQWFNTYDRFLKVNINRILFNILTNKRNQILC